MIMKLLSLLVWNVFENDYDDMGSVFSINRKSYELLRASYSLYIFIKNILTRKNFNPKVFISYTCI